MDIGIVTDIKNFYKTIGALDELSERQLIKNSELNTEEHKEYLEKLVEKYNIEVEYEDCDLSNKIYMMEDKINERFTSIMEGL